MSTRVVVDTSVIISALIGTRGPAREVVRRCLQGAYEPLISNALFQECEAVQGRESVRADCPLSAAEIRDLLNAYYSVCRWVPIYFLWRPNLRDEGDNFLVELAVAGNADLIITNNPRDLRAAELSFPGLSITTPAVLLTGESPWRP
jgi:putative PIN family toxin of toxin-antitoxin system